MGSAATESNRLRGENINLRVSRSQKTLIDRAAGALGRSRSDFMLEAACRAAESALLDRRFFELDDAAFRRFAALLRQAAGRQSPAGPDAAREGSVGQVSPLSAPEKLTPAHDLSQFSCGEPALDDWLRRRALDNEERGASRTYVVCLGRRVVGYYALAVGAVAHSAATGRIRRNMPDPVPVMVIGRLAIDADLQGQGIGSALLRDAVLRTLQAAEIAGIRAILVHALSERAGKFYESCGFAASPVDPMTRMISLTEAAKILAQP